MEGKVVLVNNASRLAAMQVDENAYVVFEFYGPHVFAKGDVLRCLSDNIGRMEVECTKENGREAESVVLVVNLLSSKMEWARAKLVVAPWQDIERANKDCQTA